MWIKVLLLASILVIGYGTFRGTSSIQTYYELKKSKEILRAAVQGLEQENQGIKEEIIKIKNSPSYARRVLRDKYHLKDENEEIIFFIE